MFIGKEQLVFWFGVVEDRLDPLELGRCRVRIIGHHPEDKKLYPTEKLPWATVIQPANTPSLSGKGTAPVGLVEGSWVLGFFADDGMGQLPIIMGSMTGMNETIQSGENYGDGFKDDRNEKELKKFPVDEFTKRSYPSGKSANGDLHGAQLQNKDASLNYPRENYSPESSGRSHGTPDLNILAINDEKRIDKTIVKIKRTPRSTGLRDTGIDVADCNNTPFYTGVLGLTGVNRGTNKLLGLPVPGNRQKSTAFPSKKQSSKQFRDKPTNNNNIRIDSGKTISGGNVLPSAISNALNTLGGI